jgi:hypothetical protein
VPREFHDSSANILGSGVTNKLLFPYYCVYTGNAVSGTRKDSVTSHKLTLFSISTKSLDYVIGAFRLSGYGTPSLSYNTLTSIGLHKARNCGL